MLDTLVDRLEPTLPGDALGEVLNRLLWLMDDNGRDLIEVCRQWLTSEDRRRVEAALSIEDSWLYEERAELRNHLAQVKERWPHLAGRIDSILGAYDRQMGDRGD
jgi:hypothetical protein